MLGGWLGRVLGLYVSTWGASQVGGLIVGAAAIFRDGDPDRGSGGGLGTRRACQRKSQIQDH